MNGLVLLKNADEWHAYRTEFASRLGVDVNQIRWGDGPAAYPCLVLSHADGHTRPPRILRCYVYEADARRLVEAAGAGKPVPASGDAPLLFGRDPVTGVLVPAPPHVQREFQQRLADGTPPTATGMPIAAVGVDPALQSTLRSMAAHQMAILSEMIAVGATNAKRYEAAYTRFLALGDRVVAEQADLGSVAGAVAEDAARKKDDADGDAEG